MPKHLTIFRNNTSNKQKQGQLSPFWSCDAPVAIIGELNVDLVASGLPSAPVLGREILAQDFNTVLGSASAIFACGVARLGHPVSFFSKIGDDEFGRFCLQRLRHAGISTKHVYMEPTAKTGVTMSLSTHSDRALVTVLGAISQLRYADLDMEALRGHSHLHMTSYFLQKKLRGSFARVFREAKKFGLTTSFDPNSDPLSSWSSDILSVIEETTILFLNKQEAMQLTRKDRVRAALDHLAERVPCVVIKLGAQGAIATSEGRTVAVPAFKISPVDTTGAGDSFAAGFIHAYLCNWNLQQCLIWANACGALSARQVGGTTGQPDLVQLSRFLRSDRSKRLPSSAFRSIHAMSPSRASR